MLQIIFLIITSILLSFILVDVFVNVNEWQKRIHIGRWNNRNEWRSAMEKKALLWLKHAPTVKKKSNTRLILWDILRGEYRSSTIQIWQDAGLILGLGHDQAQKFIGSHVLFVSKETIKPEDLLLAYALKKQGVLTSEQENIILNFFQHLKDEGTIYYRPWMKKIRYVDTIGMVVPFLYACGWNDLAIRQIEEYDEALLKGIYPAHAYDIERKLPMGVHDWCRGIGWYILALTEAPILRGNHSRIIKLANAMLQYQHEDGSFSCFFFNNKERMESSGTVLVGLLFISAYQITQESKFLIAAKKVETSLMKATRRDGALDYCQGDTYSIGHYSQCFSVMPFAQGIAIMFSKRLDTYLNANN